jgi:hypothetical protein
MATFSPGSARSFSSLAEPRTGAAGDYAASASDVSGRVAGEGDVALIREAPRLRARHHDRTLDEERPEQSRIRFITITEQKDLRQRCLCDGTE